MLSGQNDLRLQEPYDRLAQIGAAANVTARDVLPGFVASKKQPWAFAPLTRRASAQRPQKIVP